METSESSDWNTASEQVLIGVCRVGPQRLSLAFEVPFALCLSGLRAAAGHGVSSRPAGLALPFLWQQRHLVATLGPHPCFPVPLALGIEHFGLQRGFQTHLHRGVAVRLGAVYFSCP